jgi:hypothetical protein
MPMNTTELPIDKWLVVKYSASQISTLVSTHASREEAEAQRDKLNEDAATTCYGACLLVEPLAHGLTHARRSRRQVYR